MFSVDYWLDLIGSEQNAIDLIVSSPSLQTFMLFIGVYLVIYGIRVLLVSSTHISSSSSLGIFGGRSYMSDLVSSTPENPEAPGELVKTLYPYAVRQLQGYRPYMEDRYLVSVTPDWVGVDGSNTDTNDSISYFGVFDGHGGCKAADYCMQNIVKCISNAGSTIRIKNVADKEACITKALNNGFSECDRRFLEVASANFYDDGSTACVVMARENKLYVANVGDSRAVLLRGDEAIALSKDHKPNVPSELSRIQKAGGIVIHQGVWRVEGVLAVSRAFGDRRLKRFVIAEPDIQVHTYDKSRDNWLVIATDGLWDVLKETDIVDIVASTQRKLAFENSNNVTDDRNGTIDKKVTCENDGKTTDKKNTNKVESSKNTQHTTQSISLEASHIASALTSRAFERGSTDNILVLVVDLRDKK